MFYIYFLGFDRVLRNALDKQGQHIGYVDHGDAADRVKLLSIYCEKQNYYTSALAVTIHTNPDLHETRDGKKIRALSIGVTAIHVIWCRQQFLSG